MSTLCNHCINQKDCNTCDKSWKDKFIPSDDVKKYFQRIYNGVNGFNGYRYSFDNMNKDLIATHYILIEGSYYCPYCGEKMFAIQNRDTYETIGHCCICKGARDEIEYEEKLKALKEKHEWEMYELRKEYSDKLVFCEAKLLEIKHREEKRRLDFFGNIGHFSTLNGKEYHTIDDIVR